MSLENMYAAAVFALWAFGEALADFITNLIMGAL